ncbi:MAG: protein kinase [Proteobacteria bacterium]|nr:protein kinase [Pseudomonadota bacterium]
MDKHRKEHRDRLVTLSFVSVLLILIYGPGAPWFIGADRFLFDQFATHVRNAPLENGLIVSINPSNKSADEVTAEYGRVLQVFKEHNVERIIISQAPGMDSAAELPGWAAALSSGVPVFVPSDHRLADVATTTGILSLQPDSDDVLRRSRLWHLQGGIMSPSLPLSVALHDQDYATDSRISESDVAIYLTNYNPVDRLSAEEILAPDFQGSQLAGKTVFLDAEPPLVGAAAMLPSRQFVTRSEITATLLANIEQQQTVIAPTWVRALDWLVPALLAIVALLFLPGRKRRDIVLVVTVVVVTLLVIEAMFLLIGRVRLDLGRPVIILFGIGILSWWLAGGVKKASVNAFKRGSDFLTAGRLEPAFAEFRRCELNEPLATVMYKLSLAFEQQAKPERAEAVLQWMKRTHSSTGSLSKFALRPNNGIPQRLGRYVIEKRIGKGAMGAVYLARDPRINRAVALKVIPIEKEFEDEELEEARLRFFREAESAGRLTHPNIITVYDCGEDKHLAYIAMEYLQGVSLTTFTDPKKLLAPKKALELCARTAEGLDYAHNQGVIHRDIKPANILYSLRSDMLKISDFGVARLTDNNRTKTGIVLGTPMYMSPEQLNAEDLTGHSDLFSLGVTLYELLVGEVPFKASNIAVLMTRITTEDPAPVSNRRPGIPPSVDAVLFKALAKRPEKRFANGGEMAIALRNCAKYAS